jgi:hypothetical protein
LGYDIEGVGQETNTNEGVNLKNKRFSKGNRIIDDVRLDIGVPEGYDQTQLQEIYDHAKKRGFDKSKINVFEIKTQ